MKFQEYRNENVASTAYTVFFKDLTHWPILHPTSLIFNLIQDFIEANTVTKFHEYRTVNMASRAYTQFFLELT